MAYEDRLELFAPTISETLRYMATTSLPPIDSLEVNFADRLRPFRRRERIRAGISYAQELEDRLGIDDSPLLSRLKDPKSDLISVLFLDAVRIVGEEHFLSGDLTRPEVKKNKSAKDIEGSAEARKKMQVRIDDYLDLFRAADTKLQYAAFENIFFEAACLLYNLTNPPRELSGRLRGILTGVLAEHKVISAVKSEGQVELVRYGTSSEDYGDNDDIVFTVNASGLALAFGIQVKGSSDKSVPFSVEPKRKGSDGFFVRVPMYPGLDQFNLNDEEKAVLMRAVNRRVRKTSRVVESWTRQQQRRRL